MAKFLTTSAATYHLEELMKHAKERLWLISPYLKLNNRTKELLEDANRMKLDIRIVYGKSELQPAEASWLKTLTYVRTSFCQNLHAKCYLSESECIITSLNLYEFSQVNNYEMGILLTRDDGQVFLDTYEEAQRIVRISEEVKISLDVVKTDEEVKSSEPKISDTAQNYTALTTNKLAEKLGIDKDECNQRLCDAGLQELNGTKYFLTEKGKQFGGLKKGQYGYFIVWSPDIEI